MSLSSFHGIFYLNFDANIQIVFEIKVNCVNNEPLAKKQRKIRNSISSMHNEKYVIL